MEYKVPFLPESKRFFKISELAGKRWPNVTEDEIYEWHDQDYQISVNLEVGGDTLKMGDTSNGHHWNDSPHLGKVNILAYWMFFPEFCAFRQDPGGVFRHLFEDDMLSKLPNLQECQHIFNFDALDRSFLMVDGNCTKGFSFDKQGSVRCLIFYDEKGMFRAPVSFNEATKIWELAAVEIKKEDLLIRASSVQLIEAIAPKITRPDYQVKGGGAFNAAAEEDVKHLTEDQAPLSLPPGARIIEGVKEAANYIGCSVSTVRRHYMSVFRKKPHTRKFTTTTAAIDDFRLKSATKKK